MLFSYLKTMIRTIRKSSVYGFLNIAGLALGIACAALIFIWVEDELSFDHQFPKHDQLYSVQMNMDFAGKIENVGAIPGPMPDAMRGTVPGIVNFSRLGFGRELFKFNEISSYEMGLYVDTAYFSMMQLPFVKGSAAGFSNPHSLVLTESNAKKFFADADPIGKTIRVNNQTPFTVIGVIRDPASNASLRSGWLAPVSNFLDRNDWLNSWGTYGVRTLVELRPGTDVSQVNRRLTAILTPTNEIYAHSSVVLWAMNDWHLRDHFTNGQPDGGRITQVRLFAGIAWIILIIACINFMNLATARAGQRAREIGVRKTLGALRKTLIVQFLLETVGMSLAALLLSVLLVYLFLPGFNTLVQKDLHFDPLSPMHLFSLLGIGIFCGLIAGSYPAFYLSAFRPVAVLKGQRVSPGSGASIVRKGLVITQFTVSVILIVCTTLIYQQIQHVKDRNLGYNKEHLIYTDMPDQLAEHFRVLRSDLLQSGAVEEATLTNSPPLQMWGTVNSSQLSWEGSDPTQKMRIVWEEASPEYLRTMGLFLVDGRNFHTDIQSDSGNIMINETMATLMGKAGRLGATITPQGSQVSYHIIGIVKDYLFNNVYESVKPMILDCVKETSAHYGFLTIRMRSGKDLADNLAKIEAITRTYAPGYPVSYQFVDEVFNNFFRAETQIGQLAAVFAVLAIVISCLGLFGLAAFTAERRIKEIGIRKVLGASTISLATLLSNEFIRLVAISCLIAFPLAWWWMDKFLADYAYRISIHWWVFVIAGAGALFIALVTVSFQAVKAALSNPVKTLKSE